MTTSAATPTSLDARRGAIDPTARRVPPLGGLNPTLVSLEIRRLLRNRRTIIFTLVLPAALFLSFGGVSGTGDSVGSGNVSAYIMVSMGLYGAALSAAAAGAGVALERSLGWSRQLRLTPLNPVAYILVKALVALVIGALAIVVVNVVGLIQGKPEMPTSIWFECALVTLVCTLTFAALGVFAGYVVPGENAMQILGPGLALLSFLGGVFYPLTEGTTVWHIAVFTPMYGVAEVARSPLTHDPKFDVPLLEVALRLDDEVRPGYIGAMGSRRTHDERMERLAGAGLTDAELDLLSSPIGLDLGARTPEETAVSIAAEIVARR